MLLSTGSIGAAEALEIGLVNRVVAVEKLAEDVAEMAAALAANESTTDALHAAGEHDTPVPPTE